MSSQRLCGRYEIQMRIASGGMGIVYRALDNRLDRVVAIKILKEHLSHDDRFVERFRREARAVASLSHPNIASLYDYGEDEGRHFIVMEHVDGRDLATLLREIGPLDPDPAARVARQIADALAAAHRSGIVHRDIKPANVLLTDEGTTKVTDFGIARAAGDSTLTATGSILGTAHYLAPEQAAGEPASPATDVYATGIVLFEMLTGRVPFMGESPVAVATRHLNDELPATRSLNPDVPPALDAVVRKATAKDSRDRYPDGAAMRTALDGLVRPAVIPPVPSTSSDTEEISAASKTTPLPRFDPPLDGRRLGVIVLGGLAALALALLAFRLMEDPATEQASKRSDRPAREQVEEGGPAAQTVTVPDVVQWDSKAAQKQIEAAGLVPAQQGDAKGIVVGMDPPPGAEVEEGTPVNLTVEDPEQSQDDGDEDGERGPPAHSEGRGKGKKDEEKDH